MAYPPAILTSSANTANQTNANAVLTFNAVSGYGHCISGIAWSYSGTPTGGNILIQDGATTVFNMDITTSGSGFVPFSPAIESTVGNALTITLAAGGAAIVGKINALAHWIRPQ